MSIPDNDIFTFVLFCLLWGDTELYGSPTLSSPGVKYERIKPLCLKMYVLNLYSQDDSLRSEVAKSTKSTFNVCRKLLSLLYLCVTSQKMILPDVKVKKEHRCSFFWQCEKCCFESVHWIC